MTPLLPQLLKLSATTTLVKIEQRKEAQKIQEVCYVTEEVCPTEEVWEHEELVEEFAKVSFEYEVTPFEAKVSASEVDVLSATQDEKGKSSELRGKISVTDTAERKETRLVKHKAVSETRETGEVPTVKEKPAGEGFVRTMRSPTKQTTDESRDPTSAVPLPEGKDVSEKETRVTIKKGKEMRVKTESRPRQVTEQEVKEAEETVREREFSEEICVDSDDTKPPPLTVSAEARKRREKVQTTEKVIDPVTKVVSAPPEEKYRRAEQMTEILIKTEDSVIKGKTAEVIPAQDTGKEETEITLPSTDSKTGTISAREEVLVKKQEVEVTQKVKARDSVTDIEPKQPTRTRQEAEPVSLTAKTEEAPEKREESKDVRPQRGDAEKKEGTLIEDTVQTKPSPEPPERRRTPLQTAPRGIESKCRSITSSTLNASHDSQIRPGL